MNIDLLIFFFFNDTATTEIYTLSLHDALPISRPGSLAVAAKISISSGCCAATARGSRRSRICWGDTAAARSEEHTSELQSQSNLVCRLLLEKKKQLVTVHTHMLSISLDRYRVR